MSTVESRKAAQAIIEAKAKGLIGDKFEAERSEDGTFTAAGGQITGLKMSTLAILQSEHKIQMYGVNNITVRIMPPLHEDEPKRDIDTRLLPRI